MNNCFMTLTYLFMILTKINSRPEDYEVDFHRPENYDNKIG